VAYYLGIDGGGTKTTCAIGDETSLLATAVTAGCNITRVGEVRARESLHQAVHQASAVAGISACEFERACVGVAGAGRKEVAEIIHKLVAEVIPGEIQVMSDMPIALEAAFGQGPGVIVIAGTGSFAYGRNAAGTTARAGGWGFAISDEGSAHWIGRFTVREILRAQDKTGNPPPLLDQLAQACGVSSFDDFIRSANSNMDFAAFFPTILASADGGDLCARKALDEAGTELARLAAMVIARLFDERSSSSIPLATVGGVFGHASRVREGFYNEIRKLHSSVDFHREIIEPVLGALQMARRGTK
jgi:glucosamine kinase